MGPEKFNSDFPLPVFGETTDSVWGLPEPVPSTILFALPDEVMPSQDLLRSALSIVGAEESRFVELDVPLNGPPFALWVMAIGLADHPIPLIVWCEEIENPGGLPEMAAEARWMVGIQTVLDPERPLAIWSNMASLLNATWPNSVAMLDEETEQWFSRDEITLRFSTDSSSFDESVLFRIHAAATHERPEEGSSVWLRTQGLHRCGRPELEMLEVAGDVLPVAAELLESVAALIVMKGIPDPDVVFEAGMGVTLRLRPWAAQAASLSADSIGNTEHRASMAQTIGGDLTEGRAVLCGHEARGSFGSVYTWPSDIVDRLISGRCALERTPAWSTGRSLQARSMWPRLLEAFVEGQSMSACLALGDDGDDRLHVWVHVEAASETEVTGTLLQDSDQGRRGDVITSPVAMVIDWAFEHSDTDGGGG
jgi:hypothetical protein